MGEAYDKAVRAKKAAARMAGTPHDERKAALVAMAKGLRNNRDVIVAANTTDCDAARADGMNASLLDRLLLTPARIDAMANGLDQIASQSDPLGRVLNGTRLSCGLRIEQVSVPLGVVAVVYEARPNVTSDVAGLCIKSGNAVVLRPGSSSMKSCKAIVSVLCDALEEAGLPRDAITLLESPSHEAVEELFGLVGLVDVLIPRGGASLIRSCIDHARVPVIQTGIGNCHIFVERTADVTMAADIVCNAKCSRPAVCNAAETLLVDEGLLERQPDALDRLMNALGEHGVTIHGDEACCAAAARVGASAVAATDEDWGTEYLSLDMSCKIVSGFDEAVAHIAAYGTHHSECIVTEDYEAAERFLAVVDAAAVYVNASTRFTDGEMFGLGAEIGISTQRLHVRGPMGANALVTTKYLCRGDGQIR